MSEIEERQRRADDEAAVQESVDAGALRELAPVTSAALRSTNAVNALIHLYRGEMARMTEYRARLDTSANWAITTSALATTFALGAEEHSHATLLFIMALLYFFLHLESRRFSSYEASRRRVRQLERSFFPHVLGRTPDERWLEDLLDHLQRPAFPTVPLTLAMSWRLRRIYLWLYAGVLLAWLSKLDLTGLGDMQHLDIVARAAVGSIPGWLVFLGVLGLYGWLLFLALRPGREHPLANPYTHERLRSVAPARTTPGEGTPASAARAAAREGQGDRAVA